MYSVQVIIAKSNNNAFWWGAYRLLWTTLAVVCRVGLGGGGYGPGGYNGKALYPPPPHVDGQTTCENIRNLVELFLGQETKTIPFSTNVTFAIK